MSALTRKQTDLTVQQTIGIIQDVWQGRRFLSTLMRVGLSGPNAEPEERTPPFPSGAVWEKDLYLVKPLNHNAHVLHCEVHDHGSQREVKMRANGKSMERAGQMIFARL